ncbi:MULTISPECIES: hypothetical protein [Pandoraea]|uniref:hypothetical protein n=1 Tax=Pandoraea TaxID=93217 RepID=UPI001F5D68BD|nr:MULTISPECIES: hypothetical protein [Pandoraea]MCI3206030.1 hypothetical protein [Pandoraea sp. LA3]MDN4584058.1 hypothetical protein [Pandoraea capi]
MRVFKLLCAMFIVALASGCAHQVSMSPDIAAVNAPEGATRVDKHVGFVITDQLRELTVTTPGGGGDKISYKPYADTETAFYKMFSNVFTNVSRLKSSDDASTQKNALAYVVVPTITTDSSSTSLVTWPATDFTVNLKCEIRNLDGTIFATKTVTGTGHADFSEFKSDFSLSGRRAAADAMIKLQDTLLKMPELR